MTCMSFPHRAAHHYFEGLFQVLCGLPANHFQKSSALQLHESAIQESILLFYKLIPGVFHSLSEVFCSLSIGQTVYEAFNVFHTSLYSAGQRL